jgi:hypothetical protein
MANPSLRTVSSKQILVKPMLPKDTGSEDSPTVRSYSVIPMYRAKRNLMIGSFISKSWLNSFEKKWIFVCNLHAGRPGASRIHHPTAESSPFRFVSLTE